MFQRPGFRKSAPIPRSQRIVWDDAQFARTKKPKLLYDISKTLRDIDRRLQSNAQLTIKEIVSIQQALQSIPSWLKMSERQHHDVVQRFQRSRRRFSLDSAISSISSLPHHTRTDRGSSLFSSRSLISPKRPTSEEKISSHSQPTFTSTSLRESRSARIRQRVQDLLRHSRASDMQPIPKPGTWAHECAPTERHDTFTALLRLNNRLPVIEKRDFENANLEFTATWHNWLYAYARKLPSQPDLVYVQDETDAWLTFDEIQQRFEDGCVLNIITCRMTPNPVRELPSRRRLAPPTPNITISD